MTIVTIFGLDHSTGWRIGVLDTPCWPARWYAGYITSDGMPADNATGLFHRSIEDAMEAAERLCAARQNSHVGVQ